VHTPYRCVTWFFLGEGTGLGTHGPVCTPSPCLAASGELRNWPIQRAVGPPCAEEEWRL
jgi:hypothetical protein